MIITAQTGHARDVGPLEVTAPIVLDGPINGESFLAYVEQALVRTLSPGDIVVLDNLGNHLCRGPQFLLQLFQSDKPRSWMI